MEESTFYKLKKFCGTGLTYITSIGKYGTVQGNVVALIPSPLETPAKSAGIQDNDIIIAIDANGDGNWKAVETLNDHDMFLGAPGSLLGVRYYSQQQGVINEKYLTRDYIVPFFDKNEPMPSISRKDLPLIPYSEHAECHDLTSSIAHLPYTIDKKQATGRT